MFAILFEGTGKKPELKRIMHVHLCQRFLFPYSYTLSHAMLRFCTKKNLLLQNVNWVLWFLELFLMHSPFLSGKCVSVEPPQIPLMYSNCQHIPCVLHRISLCHSSGVLFSLSLFRCCFKRFLAFVRNQRQPFLVRTFFPFVIVFTVVTL